MASTKTLMISMAIATRAIQVAGKHNDIGLPCDLRCGHNSIKQHLA